MRIHYKGKLNKLTASEEKRLAGHFVRLGSLLDHGSEKEAHVILETDRRGHRAEITVNHKHRPLVGEAEGPGQLTVLTAALDKLEKQLLKYKTKRTDTKRRAISATRAEAPVEKDLEVETVAKKLRVYRVRAAVKKPITADEAVMLIGNKAYLTFRDTISDNVNVLIRRTDGHFDLVEG